MSDCLKKCPGCAGEQLPVGEICRCWGRRDLLALLSARAESLLDAAPFSRANIPALLDRIGIPEGDASRDAGAVLLASAEVGAHSKAVAVHLGWAVARVERIARRLRASGVWRRGVVHAEWGDEEGGDVAFILDALVGSGAAHRGFSYNKPGRKPGRR